MTTDEFNALPLEARRFIEANSGCMSCGGNKEEKLSKGYAVYLSTKRSNVYQLFGGGVNYIKGEKGGVLYPIDADDTDDEIREKIKIADLIYRKNPEMFISYNEAEIKELGKSLAPVKVIDLDKKPKK